MIGSPGIRPVAAMLAVAALGLFGIGLAADAAHAEPSVIGETRLFDDDGEQGLFRGTVLQPGVPVSRCLRVEAGGAMPARVLLAADAVTGDLAAALGVTIERGDGGRFGDCAGFLGTRVGGGTLTGLAARPIDTAWPAGATGQTFRITVTSKSEAATGDARATFVWSAYYAQAPAATPSSSAPAVAEPTTPAAAETTESAVAAPAAPAGRSGLDALVDIVQRLAAQAARHIAIPITMLAAMALFLLLQSRIDGRDPKLQLAPVTRSRYVWIPLSGEGRP